MRRHVIGLMVLALMAGSQFAFAANAAAAVGDITLYPLPMGADPYAITTGPDGNIWFTEPMACKVAKMTTSGVVTEYAVSAPGCGGLSSIAAGPDGNVWFVENNSNKVAKITTSGVITEYALSGTNSQPAGITAGPDGNVWFTELNPNKVASITPTGVITEYALPTPNSFPNAITAGPDGNLWFTEYWSNKVGKVTTSGVFTEYVVPTANAGSQYSIAAGPDGNLWLTENNSNKVARVTTAGVFTEFNIPSASSGAFAISAGPDGNMWFTEINTNKVASVTTIGTFAEYAIPPGAYSSPRGITAGPDGNVWFTVLGVNKVGKVVPSPNCNASTIPKVQTVSSTRQYTLTNSDGATWQELDATNLRLTCYISSNQSALLTANADLWTANAGFNQDLGIFVSDNGGADTLLAWKESGGFAGTYSPNAAYVQAVLNMTSGHAYVFKLMWKTNQSALGATIYAGAGNGPQYSQTSLVTETFQAGAVPNFAVSTKQYTLVGSDGATWQDIDATNLKTTLSPGVNSTAVLGANADLWTANSGFNQDIAIFVSDNAGVDTLVAWKESGGFAGTYSPNAAFVKAIYAMTGGHSYLFKLKWKTNVNAPGATIYSAAGAGSHSPTSLLAQIIAAGANPYNKVSTSQYTLPNSDGVTWQPIDAGTNVTVAPSADTNSIVGGNVDLWTANGGYNQDMGIFVSDNGGADALLAWKESGGFAGTFSPNAAFVQATYQMTSGHTYVFKLKWKTNRAASGTTIYAAAGGLPPYSPTRLTVELTA